MNSVSESDLHLSHLRCCRADQLLFRLLGLRLLVDEVILGLGWQRSLRKLKSPNFTSNLSGLVLGKDWTDGRTEFRISSSSLSVSVASSKNERKKSSFASSAASSS